MLLLYGDLYRPAEVPTHLHYKSRAILNKMAIFICADALASSFYFIW